MSGRSVKLVPIKRSALSVGKNYRLLCLTGQGKGKAYLISKDRVVIGRSTEVDIPVFDGKSSKLHAELKKFNDDFVLTDLGSRNGVYVNELRIKQHTLKDGEKFVIGETFFKYEIIDIEDEGVALAEDEDEEKDSTESKKKEKGKNKNKRMMIIVLLGLLAMMMMDDSEPTKKKKERNINEILNARTKKVKLKPADELDPEVKAQLDSVIHRGQREFREKNYFRAMSEFKHALNLNPENSTASYYLDKTKQALDNEVQSLFESSKKAIDSIRFTSAIIDYCMILKLLHEYPEDERFKSAKKNIEIVNIKLGVPAETKRCKQDKVQ